MDALEHPLVNGPVRLGKRGPKPDRRNLQFAKYLAVSLPAPPTSVKRSPLVRDWLMYGNDVHADCTCAAVGHIEQILSAAAGSPETPSEKDVLDLYWATGSRDDGRYCLDVLNFWRGKGFGAGREKALAFVQIDPRNHAHMKHAISLFGNVYVGLALPLSAQKQTIWRNVTGADSRPGSWGGHAVAYVDYNYRGFTCVTWGRPLRLSSGFHRHYCDEAYTVISPDWFDAHGLSPADAGSFNLAQLQADLKLLHT